ncbi:putative AMP-dependent synthetase and ligase (plasmid) [Phaeobacter inhibens]|uniref:AMP-dependent synthetase and ligase n=1 Tax=Phaeobacter inhibens TaxID=221822 RepID=A0A2I7K3F5_9RHOB|nr:AMP-binding protein [Phaeobacter inhibens]AUQ52526.1 putative AMP-dependent synthetase and ligase [Phaeobacter inhibens]AUQ97131.1 putative AMP-dependent synthetase and ligase [Phaeobacter inhibens]AUR01861.1 putative AMP-dependent synthetase and ligase [Phaeobacter inhibens]AUR22331.1 putative AMP-dependent synthetase and ligase [Phaeobacter inhibens]
MFVLNDTPLDPTALHPRLQQALGDDLHHRYALRMRDTGLGLATLLYLKDHKAGVFPIHADIPAEAAKQMATKAGCDWFLEDDLVPQPLPRQPGQTASARPGAGVLVQMSSGTTGAAKVITRSWDNISTEVRHYADFFASAAKMTPVIACPVTHSYGLIPGVLVALHRGHVPVIIDAVNPKYVLRRLREVSNPVLYTSPAMLHTLAKLLPRDEELNAAVTSGTVLPDPWFQLIRARTRHLFQQYGCSEVGCIAINQDLQAPCDVGHPLPHLDLQAGALDTPGPVRVQLTTGGPATTDAAGGNWVETGDLGYLAADGGLVFTARADDMINVAGLNVYPQDVERAVMGLPGVEDAVAFRMPDPQAGARVGLLFVSATLSETQLRAQCADLLADHQKPAQLRRLPALPRQANGKISRREIAERYASDTDHTADQQVPA